MQPPIGATGGAAIVIPAIVRSIDIYNMTGFMHIDASIPGAGVTTLQIVDHGVTYWVRSSPAVRASPEAAEAMFDPMCPDAEGYMTAFISTSAPVIKALFNNGMNGNVPQGAFGIYGGMQGFDIECPAFPRGGQADEGFAAAISVRSGGVY